MGARETLDALAERLERGEQPPLAAVKAALAAARAEADASPGRARALVGAVRRLTEVIQERQGALREDMAGAGRGRRAAKGYGKMRAHKRGQRIRIKA